MEDRWALLTIAVMVALDKIFGCIRIDFFSFFKYSILFLKIGLEMIYITVLDSELMNLRGITWFSEFLPTDMGNLS